MLNYIYYATFQEEVNEHERECDMKAHKLARLAKIISRTFLRAINAGIDANFFSLFKRDSCKNSWRHCITHTGTLISMLQCLLGMRKKKVFKGGSFNEIMSLKFRAFEKHFNKLEFISISSELDYGGFIS